MANKRNLKKNINAMVYDVVDECYSLQLFDDSKKEETEKFIDEVADFHEEIMSAISKAKTRAEFKAIEDKFYNIEEVWIERINKLQ